LPGLAGGNQGGADARIETDLLVNGASVGLKSAGMPRLGLVVISMPKVTLRKLLYINGLCEPQRCNLLRIKRSLLSAT
jgi:hypothetical protein